MCFYHMIFFVSGIDMGGRSLEIYVACGFLYIAGAMFCAVIYGEIANTMTELNKKAAIFAEVQDQIYTTMKNMQLPDDLQLKIADFLFATYHILERNEEYENFIKFLPPSLKNEVNKKIYRPIFEKNPILIHSSAQALDFVINRLENTFCQPDYPVVTQFGDQGDFYFIADGKCEVEVLDEFRSPHKIRLLTDGDHFGEIALLYNTERTATVRTITYTNLAVVSASIFNEIVKLFPDVKESLEQSASHYMDH